MSEQENILSPMYFQRETPILNEAKHLQHLASEIAARASKKHGLTRRLRFDWMALLFECKAINPLQLRLSLIDERPA